MTKVYSKIQSRGKACNGHTDFIVLKTIVDNHYCLKSDPKLDLQYIDTNFIQTNDIIVPKTDIYKVDGIFPVKVYVDHDGEKNCYACLQHFSMIYNQLFRDCSCRPYGPYGDYFSEKDNNKVKDELNNDKTNEDLL